MAAKESDINAAYNNLAKEVVIKAVESYRKTLIVRAEQLRTQGYTNEYIANKLKELEAFFNSDYCSVLCGFDGSTIITNVKRQVV